MLRHLEATGMLLCPLSRRKISDLMFQALFQCLETTCLPDLYGTALASVATTCSDSGAHIGPLHPVELAVQQQLIPRSMGHPGFVSYGPTANGGDGAAGGVSASLPFMVLDCNTGPDGVLTLSPASGTSPTTSSAPSSSSGSSSSANNNGNSGSGSRAGNGQGSPSNSGGSSSSSSTGSGDPSDSSACVVDPNASFPQDFGYPGPECVEDGNSSDPASDTVSPGAADTSASSGDSGANAATGGLGNSGPASPCGATDAPSGLNGACEQDDDPGPSAGDGSYPASVPSPEQDPGIGSDPCDGSGSGRGDNNSGNGCPQSSSGDSSIQAPVPVAQPSDGGLADDADCDDADNHVAPANQAAPSSAPYPNDASPKQVDTSGSAPADGEPCPDEGDSSD